MQIGGPPEPLLVSIERTLQQIPVCRKTLWELVERGELVGVSVGRRKFVTAASIADFISRGGAGGASEPYGAVDYADPGYLDAAGNQASKSGKKPVKRFPINDEAHCRNAWQRINQPKSASQYTAEQLASIKGRIKAAAKKFGIQIDDSSRSAVSYNAPPSVIW